jgi:hypothetical protein
MLATHRGMSLLHVLCLPSSQDMQRMQEKRRRRHSIQRTCLVSWLNSALLSLLILIPLGNWEWPFWAQWSNLKHVPELIVPWPIELTAHPLSLEKPSPSPSLHVEPSEWSLAVCSSSLQPSPSETLPVPIAENPTPRLELHCTSFLPTGDPLDVMAY